MSSLKVIFFGTPDFAIPALEMLLNHPRIEISYVVSMPDRPAGRGHTLTPPPVATFAKEHNLPLLQTENINREDEFLNNLATIGVDLIIVLAFAQFLGSKILNLPKIGCFNIHTSLLPKYRGAAPIQFAIINGDCSTGVCIQKMVKKMDAGDILLQDPVEIFPNETGGQLYTRLKFQAALTLNNFIEHFHQLTPQAQDESQVSFAPTLKKADGLLLFDKKTSTEIFNQIRGLFPWPGSFFFLNDKRIKVLSAKSFEDRNSISPNQIMIENDAIWIGCKRGALKIETLQCENKKCCNSKDFINGFKNILSTSPHVNEVEQINKLLFEAKK